MIYLWESVAFRVILLIQFQVMNEVNLTRWRKTTWHKLDLRTLSCIQLSTSQVYYYFYGWFCVAATWAGIDPEQIREISYAFYTFSDTGRQCIQVMYTRKSKGPKILPWRIPPSIILHEEKQLGTGRIIFGRKVAERIRNNSRIIGWFQK